MAVTQCPVCAAAVAEPDVYCEACGHELSRPAPARAAEAVAGRWISSSGGPAACPGCGGATFGPEGYCDNCGQRRSSGKDRSELQLGALAAVTDKGHRHARNEDAVGLALLASTVVGVICDGVSSSTRPDTASNGAVDAALAAVVAALDDRSSAGEAIGAAARAGQAAATLVAGAEPGANPPAATFVCAVVEPDAVTVGWIGDSRAYWLPDADGDPACLTVDDSVSARFAAKGMPVPAEIPHSQANALVRWLGADATDTVPHLYSFAPSGPGRVLVCSDGMFRYRPGAADLARATPRVDPLATAQALVQLALDAGGQDNIAVAVLPFPPHPRRPGMTDDAISPAEEPS
jgi:PPM family protein phosphatase